MNQRYDELTVEEKILLNSELQRRSKNKIVAWLLWTCSNCFGTHRYYLGKTKSAIVMTLLSLTIIGLIFTIIWGFLDIFNISTWLKEDEAAKKEEIIDEILKSRNTNII